MISEKRGFFVINVGQSHQCRTGGRGWPVSSTGGSLVSTGRVEFLSDLCSFLLESFFLMSRVQVVGILTGVLNLGPSENN